MCSAAASATEAFGEGAEIYGYATSPTAGIYTLTSDGYELLWKDNGYSGRLYVPMTSGWLTDDKMCGYANDGYDAFYVEYDWETGDILKSESLTASTCPTIATLNVAEGKIYGFLAKAGQYKFFTSATDDPTATTLVTTVDKEMMCLGLTYNSADGYVVGARADGSLVKVNADGSQELLLATHYTVPSDVSYTALTYCAADGLYYWNPTNSSWETEMYVIDPNELSIANVATFPDKQWKFMLSPGQPVDSESPKAPEIVSAEFIGGSADGKFVVRMPGELESGDAISGDVAWVATIDGVTAKEGTAAAGAEVTVELSGVATGNHTFAFAATVGDKTGKAASQVLYVGFDTPKAPANVVLTEVGLSWEAVTAGVNGGYVNTEAIMYTVSLNDEQVATIDRTEYAFENLDKGELRRIIASVTATANELTSAPGLSNGLTVGSLSLPAYFRPTAEDFELCQTIDGDGNGRGWSYDAANEAFFASYNLDTDVDDWLILPGVNLSGESACAFSMQTRRMRSYFDGEAIEVRAAMQPTAEALAAGVVVIEETGLPAAFEEFNGSFTPDEAGKWYIGLHAVSDADQAGLFVKEVLISENGVTPASPADVTELKAEAAAGATLEATVSFKLPETTVGGDPIDAATVIEATVSGASVATVSGAPGQSVETVVATVQGLNRISVTTAIGELPGTTVYVEVYTGYDVPGKVVDLTTAISADMMSAEISWAAPTEGLDGGVIDPEALTYNIYVQKSSSVGNYWELLEEGVEATTYTFATESTVQDVYTLGVAAANVADVNPVPSAVLIVLGTPYALPMVETFDNPPAYYTYNYWVTYMPTEEYDTQWGVLPVEVLPFFDTTEWNVVLCGMGLSDGALGRCGFPVFSTKGHDAVALTAPFWTGSMATPDVRVTGMCYGMTEPIEVGTVSSNGTWNEVTFMLPDELIDKEWVSLFIEASFPEGTSQWVCMDGYTITPVSAVSNIEIEGNADPAEYYNLQGILVQGTPAPGLYIRRQGQRIEKVVVK